MLSSVVGVTLICIQFIGPLLILVYCNGRIVWILTRRIDLSIGSNEQQCYKNNPNVDKFQLARKNTIKTFLMVGLCFVICWSSNQVYYLMYTLGFKADWNGFFYKFSVLMLFFNCTVNPFIYLFQYQDYQKALKVCFKYRSPENTETFSSSVVARSVHV